MKLFAERGNSRYKYKTNLWTNINSERHLSQLWHKCYWIYPNLTTSPETHMPERKILQMTKLMHCVRILKTQHTCQQWDVFHWELTAVLVCGCAGFVQRKHYSISFVCLRHGKVQKAYFLLLFTITNVLEIRIGSIF